MSAIIFLISSFLGSKPSALGRRDGAAEGACVCMRVGTDAAAAASALLLQQRQLALPAAAGSLQLQVRLLPHLMATLSSLASIVPEPSVSNRSNASLISCFCSSVSPADQRQSGDAHGSPAGATARARLARGLHLQARPPPAARTARAPRFLVLARRDHALAVAHAAGRACCGAAGASGGLGRRSARAGAGWLTAGESELTGVTGGCWTREQGEGRPGQGCFLNAPGRLP